MTSLVTLALCAVVPWIVCSGLRAWLTVDGNRSSSAQERALVRYRRATLWSGAIGLPLSAVAGALVVDPVLSTRWPVAGAWFFASVCTITTWSSLALAQRTADEARAMSVVETIGRVVQMAAVPSLAVALSLLVLYTVETEVPMVAGARAVLTGLLSVAAVIVVSPWLANRLGLWRLLPFRVDAEGVTWRVAHLPVPAPFLTHTAALPWLRTVLVTDGLLQRAPAPHWRALVLYEVGGARHARGDRAARWSVAIPLSLVLFITAGAVGGEDPRKLVAATILAVLFTGVATWFANREPSSKLALDAADPSVQELAQTLRSLPPAHGQALPRTSHRPLGPVLYDRLFALGHDPGPRPHS
ncbi:MAG: hypothetical protein JSV06_13350 [Myxococcales bacterium]|nr:MAG: hypothetical protein JSV06_13350 [Myxococcales bacterium]